MGRPRGRFSPGMSLSVTRVAERRKTRLSCPVSSRIIPPVATAAAHGAGRLRTARSSATSRARTDPLARAAARFNQISVVYPTAEGEDVLAAHHANDQVPRFVGTDAANSTSGLRLLRPFANFTPDAITRAGQNGNPSKSASLYLDRIARAFGPISTARIIPRHCVLKNGGL